MNGPFAEETKGFEGTCWASNGKMDLDYILDLEYGSFDKPIMCYTMYNVHI